MQGVCVSELICLLLGSQAKKVTEEGTRAPILLQRYSLSGHSLPLQLHSLPTVYSDVNSVC